MPKITIKGVDSRVDGSYDLDLDDSFTYGELDLIKKVAGARGAEIGEAMEAGDTAIIIALTKIALDRADVDVPVKRLMDAKVGAIEFGDTEAEKAAEAAAEEDEKSLPPANAPTGASEPRSEKSTSKPSTDNGSDSLPATVLPGTGVRPWPTGSVSNPPT